MKTTRVKILTRSRGFTMVELLMTITLVAILSAVATTQFLDFRKEAKIAATQKKLYELRDALDGNPELIANGQYVKPGAIIDLAGVPTSLSALISQGSYSSFNVFNKRGWRGPYIDSTVSGWSQDAWSVTFSYSPTSRWIESCGPDGVCGGSSSADDIVVSF